MMCHLHPVARRVRRHTPPFGDATGQRHVGVENIDGTAFDQIATAPALHLTLPSRDADASGGPYLVHTAHLVVPVHGFLEPGDVTVSYATRKGNGVCDRIAHVRITGDDKIITNGLPHLLDARNVFLWGPSTHFKLHTGVAGFAILKHLLNEPCDALTLRVIPADDDGLQPCLRCPQEAKHW